MAYALFFVSKCIHTALNFMYTLFNGIPGSYQVWLAGALIFSAGRFLLIPISGAYTGQLASDVVSGRFSVGDSDSYDSGRRKVTGRRGSLSKQSKRKVSGKRGSAKKG